MPNYSTRDVEVKKLRQNQTKIANQLKIYANKMAISRATERLEADFYKVEKETEDGMKEVEPDGRRLADTYLAYIL